MYNLQFAAVEDEKNYIQHFTDDNHFLKYTDATQPQEHKVF